MRELRVSAVHNLSDTIDFFPREEFERAKAWLELDVPGLLSLVGIAGAGKTVLAGKLLQEVQSRAGSLENLGNGGGAERSKNLKAIDAVLTFSFRLAPDPESFFHHLDTLLGSLDASLDEVSEEDLGQRYSLVNAGKVLLILDSLDEIQEKDLSGEVGLGHIAHKGLRDLLISIGTGNIPNAAALVTTRFPLTDFALYSDDTDLSSLAAFQEIQVDRFLPGESAAFLRSRRVVASDARLQVIAEECEHHALTLDFAASYIADDPAATLNFSLLGLTLKMASLSGNVEPGHLAALSKATFAASSYYLDLLSKVAFEISVVLSRACLFGSAVDVDTLFALLFKEIKEGGSSDLEWLDRPSFDNAIEALVGLRLVRLVRLGEPKSPRIWVHPIIRLSFTSGQLEYLKARSNVRWALERAYMKTAHLGLPGDEDRLSILEELVTQDLLSGDLESAWATYDERCGGYNNLGSRLSECRRGERICRLMAEFSAACEGAAQRRITIMEDWALYLVGLGELFEADLCLSQMLGPSRGEQSPRARKILAQILALQGRLTDAIKVSGGAIRALQVQENAQDLEAYALRAYALTLRGKTIQAIDDLAYCLAWLNTASNLRVSLYEWLGISHLQLHARLGRHDDAKRGARAMKYWLDARWEPMNAASQHCTLILVDLGSEPEPVRLTQVKQVAEWAEQQGAKELLCHSLLVHSRLIVNVMSKVERVSGAGELAEECLGLIGRGLDIARSCGYGIYHCDLLVERARLQLLLGNLIGAENDALTALNGSMAAIRERCILPILAAKELACGYVWGESSARQILAEVYLAYAANMIGEPRFNPSAISNLPSGAQEMLRKAEAHITVCRRLREEIRHPDLEKTERTIQQIERGELPHAAVNRSAVELHRKLRTFISYNSKDKQLVDKVVQRLKDREVEVWLDELNLLPGDSWQEMIENELSTIDSATVFVGAAGIGPWQIKEVRVCLSQAVKRGMRVIPVLLPNAPSSPELPHFLREFTYIDLREGITDEKLALMYRAIQTPTSAGEKRLAKDLGKIMEPMHGQSVTSLGPVFISYRYRDGHELAVRLAWALRSAGVPVWHDEADMLPGDTTTRLQEALAGGLSGAILLVTPEIGDSVVVKNVEFPELLQLHANPDFTFVIANAIINPDMPGHVDRDAPGRLLGQSTEILKEIKQYPTFVDEACETIAYWVARSRMAIYRRSGEETLAIDLQTRSAPQAFASRAGLVVRTLPPPSGSRAPSAEAWIPWRSFLRNLPTLVEASGARQVRILGGAHLAAAFALGAALPETARYPMAVQDQKENLWEAKVQGPPVGLEFEERFAEGARGPAAVFVDLVPFDPPGDVFGGLLEQRPADFSGSLRIWLATRLRSDN